MSFARRVELMQRIRELARRAEFLNAGEDGTEKMDAALLGAEIDRLYVTWGVEEVRGLEIDGAAATPESLAEAGPEGLFREALEAVKARVRAVGGREKKLIVAFHFQFSNQAGWECDACRRAGLEVRRRCGWTARGGRDAGARGVGAEEGGVGGVSEVVHHGAEHCVGGGVSGAAEAGGAGTVTGWGRGRWRRS